MSHTHGQGFVDQIAELDRLAEALKIEAKYHSQEARTANATIAEIYQVCSGGTGEPGNWHGADPVRQKLAELEAKNERLLQALKAVRPWFGSGTHSGHRFIPQGYWPHPLLDAEKLVNAAIQENTKQQAKTQEPCMDERKPLFTRPQPSADDRITECARRLVEHADFALGGCLSASSKASDIPSNACSQVKTRHLAALRDALAAKNGAEPK